MLWSLCFHLTVIIRNLILIVSSHDYIAAIKRVINIKYLSDLVFPDVKKIILVIDNINTHKPASIYKVFKPKETQRIIKRLQIHYNPKH